MCERAPRTSAPALSQISDLAVAPVPQRTPSATDVYATDIVLVSSILQSLLESIVQSCAVLGDKVSVRFWIFIKLGAFEKFS